MPLEHLLDALKRDAAAQATALAAEASAQAAAITAESDGRATRRRTDVLSARRGELVAAMELALADTRRTARRAALDARARLLDRVFDTARGLFSAEVGAAPYRAALPHQLAAALRAAGDDPAVIRCSKTLAPHVRAALPPESRAEVRVDAGVGPGFRVTAGGGVMEVDATLEGRLERLRPALAITLLARLAESR